MSPIPVHLRPAKARELLSEGVRRRILQAILDGTLTAGERLHDDELIAWLGVSRTPIRTALERLTETGLVEMEPNRFTRVSSPSKADLSDALEVYRTLQTELIGEVAPKLTERDLNDLEVAATRARAEIGGRHGGHGRHGAGMAEPVARAESAAGGDLFAFFARRSDNAVLVAALAEVELRLEFFFRSVGGEPRGDDLGPATTEILRGARDCDADAVVLALTTFLNARALRG